MYDPNLPQENTLIDAAQMRGQLQGLKDLIDAIPAGPPGPPGQTGGTGIQGPPFASAVIDSVLTLNPGDPAAANVSFDGTNVHFQFAIPRGFTGTDGGMGAQGLPGEVSNAQLSTAINGTSSNSNAVSTLNTPFTNDPPTLADLEVMRAKMNELITALRR